jgi:hypothetical protein
LDAFLAFFTRPAPFARGAFGDFFALDAALRAAILYQRGSNGTDQKLDRE